MIGRIRDRDAFVRLRRDGVRVGIDPLWCSYLHDPSLRPPRVAFAIGRAVGSATRRNRVRRRLRALLAEMDVPPGLLLIGVRPRVVELTFDELRQVLEDLLVTLWKKVPA